MNAKFSLIVANWKMNGDRALASTLIPAIMAEAPNARWVCCPPAPLLPYIHDLAPSVMLGGQDSGTAASGAYTGAVSALHLREAGALYVIVGHSERRQYQHETSEDVCQKAKAAKAAALIPIVCIGESLETYETGQTVAYLTKQLHESTWQLEGPYIIAYEPIWAIGTGKTPTVVEIEAIHSALAELAPGVPLLYGGSANAQNAADILAVPHVDGLLVGGASLKKDDFVTMLKAACV
jgi:triosephosphate isomerase